MTQAVEQTNLISELSAEGVLTLTLNRPKANAFDFALIDALSAAIRQAGRNAQVRVVLITGAGHIFSAGQDLTEFGRAAATENLSFREHLQRTYNPLVLAIRQIERPVIAAINGAVAGAALGVALACDIRLASDAARLVVGFAGIGLAPDSGVSLFLPTLIGLGRAAELTFTNQPITAEQALAYGLVNQVYPAAQFAVSAQAYAAELARGPVGAMALAKRAFNRAMYPHLEQVLDYEAHIQEIAGQGAEHKEGVQAFLEKRPADYLSAK